MAENIKADLEQLKQSKSNFNNEKNHYMYSTYNAFSGGYVSTCNDYYVQKMRNNLSEKYNDINNAYAKINNWWDNYNKNLEGLEKSLINHDNSIVNITNSSVISAIRSLPKLTDYQLEKYLLYKNHYSQKATKINNINIGSQINARKAVFDGIASSDSINTNTEVYSNGIISILLGDDKIKKPGVFSIFQKKHQEVIDKYNLDKFGINYYDIKKVDQVGNLLYVDLDNGYTVCFSVDDNSVISFSETSGQTYISNFSKYGVPAGSIKSIDNSYGAIIVFTLNNGSEITFSKTTYDVISLKDSKGNNYSYSKYQLSNYGVSPQDVTAINKNGSYTIIELNDGSKITLNNNYEVVSIVNNKGINLRNIFDEYHAGNIGVKLPDIVDTTSSKDGYCVTLSSGKRIYFNEETKEINWIVDSNNKTWFQFYNGHIVSSNNSPNIFREENIDNKQYGGSQMDFKNHANDLLNNPDIRKVLSENFPDASMEDYDLLLRKMSNCGCGYAACINAIFNIYQGREEDFYNDFGISMYDVDVNGNVDYNYEPFILEYFTYVYHDYFGMSIEDIYGNIDELSGNDASLTNEKGTGAWGSDIETYNQFDDYLKKKYGVDISVSVIDSGTESESIISKYNEILESFPDGKIAIGTGGYDLYNINEDGTRGNINLEDGGGHAMSIVGIENGEIIVSSWGNKYILDISDLGEDGYSEFIIIN